MKKGHHYRHNTGWGGVGWGGVLVRVGGGMKEKCLKGTQVGMPH